MVNPLSSLLPRFACAGAVASALLKPPLPRKRCELSSELRVCSRRLTGRESRLRMMRHDSKSWTQRVGVSIYEWLTTCNHGIRTMVTNR